MPESNKKISCDREGGREIESERETAYLLKSKNMKNRLLDAMKRDEAIPFEAVYRTVSPLCE